MKNLPALKRVKLESKSFMKASDVMLENLPSLTTMTLEDEALEGSPTIHDDVCVSYDGSLAMKNLPSLNKLCFGIKSFAYTGIVHLENVPHPIDTGHSHTHFLSIREFSCKNADGMKDAIRRAIRSQYE